MELGEEGGFCNTKTMAAQKKGWLEGWQVRHWQTKKVLSFATKNASSFAHRIWLPITDLADNGTGRAGGAGRVEEADTEGWREGGLRRVEKADTEGWREKAGEEGAGGAGGAGQGGHGPTGEKQEVEMGV
jgi:hypothetical protein